MKYLTAYKMDFKFTNSVLRPKSSSVSETPSHQTPLISPPLNSGVKVSQKVYNSTEETTYLLDLDSSYSLLPLV